MEAPGEEQKIPTASEFLAAFYPAVATGVVCLTLFPLIRSHFPDVYDPKRERVRLGGSTAQREDVQGMPPELPKFTLDWLKLLWTFTDEDIVRYCGADALMFLRFLRLGFQASILMMVYALCVLVPINSQGSNKLHGFDRLSAANVGTQSSMMWAHFVGAYLFSLGLLYFLYKEYTKYVELRQDYMKTAAVQNYSIVIRDIPKDVDRSTVERYLSGLLGNESVAIHLVEDAKPYDALIGEKDDALFKLESARAKYEKNPGVRPTHKLGFLGLWGERVDSLEHWDNAVKEANEKILQLKEQERGFAHAAIVTFETIRVATAFQNIPLQQHVRFMKVNPAPARNDVLFDNLGEPSPMRWVRGVLVAAAVFFLIFFYTIPVGFLAGLGNLTQLSQMKGLTWLKPVADWNPKFTAFLQGFVPPFVLSLFFSLAPWFMLLLSRQEKPLSESDAQASAIWKTFLFVLFDSFLVYTFAGSATQKIDQFKDFKEHPAGIIDLLSQSLPQQASFFMNLIMLAALSAQPLELLRAVPLILTKLKRRFLAASTWDHLQIMTADMEFHEFYWFPLLVFLVMCAYATLSPFVLVFTAAYFGIAYVVNLNQLLYVYNVPYHTGGKQYPVVFRCCIVAIVMFQLLVSGVLGLKRMPVAAGLMFPLIGFTAYWGNELARQFRFVGNTLTLENLLSTDLKEMAPDTLAALKRAYALHQDDGTAAELSHKAKQPLIEPFAVTMDGRLATIAEEDEMELGEAEPETAARAAEAEAEESKFEKEEDRLAAEAAALKGVPVAATATAAAAGKGLDSQV